MKKKLSNLGREKLEQAISCLQTFAISQSDDDARDKVAIMTDDLKKIIKERS